MKVPKNIKKYIWIFICMLLAVQVVWYVVVQNKVEATQTKTTGTVVSLEEKSNNCPSGSRNYGAFCDHSNEVVPVYEYFDEFGQRYEYKDEFFGNYKKNNPLIKIFGKEVGETSTVFYTNGKPSEAIVMSGPFSYAAWFMPTYIVLMLASFTLFIYLLFLAKRKFIHN